MSGHKKGWTLVCEPLDYLDGIQSGLVVKKNNGAPVAYMFDHKEAQLAAAAPDLLEAAREFVRKVEAGEARSTKSYAAFKAAIARADGGE